MSLSFRPTCAILTVLAASLATTAAHAEESNRNEIRANIERGEWTVVWGKNFTEADWARGAAAIASSVASDNPGPFLAWFEHTLDENFQKITRNLKDVTRRDLERWVTQSLKEKKVITYRGLQIDAGFATYDRWERLVYNEPRSRMEMKKDPITGIKTKVPVFYTERVERKANLPNWHQFYIRYKLLGSRSNNSGGGGQPASKPAANASHVQFKYTIRNDSGKTVRFRLPSGRDYTLQPKEKSSYTFSGEKSRAIAYVYSTRRSYQLTQGEHRFWWMPAERRIGLDIAGR